MLVLNSPVVLHKGRRDNETTTQCYSLLCHYTIYRNTLITQKLPSIGLPLNNMWPFVRRMAKESDPSHYSLQLRSCGCTARQWFMRVCNWVLIKSVSGARVIVCFQVPPCVSLGVIGCYQCCECMSRKNRASGQVTVWLHFGKWPEKSEILVWKNIWGMELTQQAALHYKNKLGSKNRNIGTAKPKCWYFYFKFVCIKY